MNHLKIKRVLILNGLFVILLILVSTFALLIGPSGVGFSSLQKLWLTSPSQTESVILFEIRLPRIILAGLVGAALSVSGVTFQALLRNPLAEPFILGVTGGAALGGVIALMLKLDRFSFLLIPFCSFLGALFTMILIYAIATADGRLDVIRLLLIGVIFNALSSAIVLFISAIVSAEKLQEIIFWLMGSLSTPREPMMIGAVFLYVAVGIFFILIHSYRFNLLAIGDEDALQLGIPVERTKTIAFFAAALMTGAVVSISGMIGFVGLAVPHILRRLFGPDHRLLLPLSATVGAIFLIGADTTARTIVAPTELPVGVITALCGGPFFLWLLRSKR